MHLRRGVLQPAIQAGALPCASFALTFAQRTRAIALQDGDGQACAACMEGAVCLGGTRHPYAAPGFWNSGQPDDYAFYACPGGASSCAGGHTNDDGSVAASRCAFYMCMCVHTCR